MTDKLYKVFGELLNKYKNFKANISDSNKTKSNLSGKKKLVKLSHILIIDDDPSCLNTLELLLRSQNYNVLKTNDGKTALEYLSDHPELIDLVLLDLMMPEIDGFDILKEMAQNEKLKNIPVIIQSGIVDQTIVNKISHKAVKGYITKPYRKKELISIIENIDHN